MQDSTLVVIVADLHVNSTVALCPPVVQRDAGGVYHYSDAQAWIWQCWQDFWSQVERVKQQKLLTVVLGDAVDLNQHNRTELIEYDNTVVITDAAAEVLRRPWQMSDELFIVRGTEAHTGHSGRLEERLARELNATPDEESDTCSWRELPLEEQGVLFDLRHHPQTSARRPWTKDAAAGRQAAITYDEYCEEGETPPAIVCRGHVHYFGQGFSRGTYGAFIPPWQLTTPFGHRIGLGGRVEPIGGLVFEVRDGDWSMWNPERTRYKPTRRRPWTSRR